ncbi:SDR family oxidoreductase [Kutzneria viridogrisea]
MTKNQMLVTGGTGTLGRQIVDRLLDRGQPVRVLSRTARQGRVPSVAVDLRTGAGLDAALDGVGTVVHCASGMGKSDVDAARNLVRAARAAGSPHVVYISIVGIDRVPLGYYEAKLATERVLAESGLPLTILRTTQFHDLLGTVFGALAKSPVVPAFSAVRFQPIDSGEVAERMTELALGEPKGRVADIGWPAGAVAARGAGRLPAGHRPSSARAARAAARCAGPCAARGRQPHPGQRGGDRHVRAVPGAGVMA